MNTFSFVRKSGRQSDLGKTFEITIENVNRCVWCTVPGLMVPLQPTSVKG